MKQKIKNNIKIYRQLHLASDTINLKRDFASFVFLQIVPLSNDSST
jgi:hypothetical protein